MTCSSFSMDKQRLLDALGTLSGKSVLIVGDVMLDQYIFGKVDRISPEAPVPVVCMEHEEFRLGGASNVARNIASLGGDCLLFGVLGNDAEGRRVHALLGEHKIRDYCCTEDSHPTTTKTRIIAQQQQVVRIDKENSLVSNSDIRKTMLQTIAQELASCSVIIISDYGKGLVTPEFVSQIRDLGRKQEKKVTILVDPKPKNFKAYQGVDLLTPNAKEAGIEGGAATSLEEIVEIGKNLRSRLESKQLLITLGSRGMLFFESPNKAVHIPTSARKVYDVTGAGDTVIAVLGLALASGMSALDGCLLANYAAGLVVGQVGAAVVDQHQLGEAVRDWPALSLHDIVL